MKRKIMMLLICGIMGAGMLTGCSSDNGNVNEEVTKEVNYPRSYPDGMAGAC